MLLASNIENTLARPSHIGYTRHMKVIEKRINNRTGEHVEVSWGNVITSDFSVIGSVMNIIEHKREQESRREAEDHNPALDRFTTVAIHIEL